MCFYARVICFYDFRLEFGIVLFILLFFFFSFYYVYPSYTWYKNQQQKSSILKRNATLIIDSVHPIKMKCHAIYVLIIYFQVKLFTIPGNLIVRQPHYLKKENIMNKNNYCNVFFHWYLLCYKILSRLLCYKFTS